MALKGCDSTITDNNYTITAIGALKPTQKQTTTSSNTSPTMKTVPQKKAHHWQTLKLCKTHIKQPDAKNELSNIKNQNTHKMKK